MKDISRFKDKGARDEGAFYRRNSTDVADVTIVPKCSLMTGPPLVCSTYFSAPKAEW